MKTKKEKKLDKSQQKVSDLIPVEPCHKCGKTVWNFTSEKCVWSCTCCGNLIYYMFGVLDQQIDRVMASSERSKEFVYTETGDGIRPKHNEEIKYIKYHGLAK